jgi:hypothetical protein
VAPDYRAWQRGVWSCAAHYHVRDEAGCFAHGQQDPAMQMLAEATHDALEQSSGLECRGDAGGDGLVGAVGVSEGAKHVWLTDRSLLHVEAARRTLSSFLHQRGGEQQPKC